MANVAVIVLLKTSKKTCEVPGRKLTGIHWIFLKLRICLLLNRSWPGTRLGIIFMSIHSLSILLSNSQISVTFKFHSPLLPNVFVCKAGRKKKNNLQANCILEGQVGAVLWDFIKKKKRKKSDQRAVHSSSYKRPHEAEKSLRSKLKMYNSNVLSTLLYRAQTWQLKQIEEKMLLTASVHKLFLESDGSNKLPTRRSAWQPTIHLYQTPSGRNDSGFCVLDMAPSSRDWQNKWPIGNLSSKLLTTELRTIQQCVKATQWTEEVTRVKHCTKVIQKPGLWIKNLKSNTKKKSPTNHRINAWKNILFSFEVMKSSYWKFD